MQSLFFWNDIYESAFENRLYVIVVLGRKQPAVAVSLLNFEPKVSKFPVIKSDFSDFITHTTM